MNLNQCNPGDIVVETQPPHQAFARAFVVTERTESALLTKSTFDNQIHAFNFEHGTASTLPGMAVQVERRVSEWIDEEHCSLRCILGTDPSLIASRVAFIEKTPRIRTRPFTDIIEDSRGWEQGPKGCAPEYGRYEPSREWCDGRLVDLGYDLPLPAGGLDVAVSAVPISQLTAYLSENGGVLAVAGKTYKVDNIRNEADLGFFADVHGPRSKYLAMTVDTKITSKPGAEVWDVLRMTGKGCVVLSFAIHAGKAFHVGT